MLKLAKSNYLCFKYIFLIAIFLILFLFVVTLHLKVGKMIFSGGYINTNKRHNTQINKFNKVWVSKNRH
jgi:hypothetical protein